MFSHVINNPNNFVINKTNFYIIPFGSRCTSAIACKFANIRNFSFPFDWCMPVFPHHIKNVLEHNFEDFIPANIHNGVFYNKYGFGLIHFNSDIDKGIEEYKRRIDRFNDFVTHQKKIYFIYINEDYLYNPDYRDENFNKFNFNQMLELENLIKEKYINIDYNILYFNFKHHDIPKNSNIINIILYSNSFFNNSEEAKNPIAEFRVYCGRLVSQLFDTGFIMEFIEEDFRQ